MTVEKDDRYQFKFLCTREGYEKICRLSLLMDISEGKVIQTAIEVLEVLHCHRIKSTGLPIVPKNSNNKGE